MGHPEGAKRPKDRSSSQGSSASTDIVMMKFITFARRLHRGRRRRRRTPRADATDRPASCASRRLRVGLSESEIRDRDIAFFEQRATEDTASANDRSQLATLYMDRARATGGILRLRARRTTGASVAGAADRPQRADIRPSRRGAVGPARFRRCARRSRRQVDSLDPGVPAHIALLGEIELETGDYAAANAHFASLKFDAEQFTIAARVARWRELTGNADAARRLLRGAVEEGRASQRPSARASLVVPLSTRRARAAHRQSRLRGSVVSPRPRRLSRGLPHPRRSRATRGGARPVAEGRRLRQSGDRHSARSGDARHDQRSVRRARRYGAGRRSTRAR